MPSFLATPSRGRAVSGTLGVTEVPRKPLPERPEKPFRLSSLDSRIDIVARFTKAGFEHVPDEHVCWHYSFFMQFLWEKGYILRTTTAPGLALAKTDLWSNELTIKGYQFAQYAEDRWLERLRKLDDKIVGRKYLEKWHRTFEQLPPGTFEVKK